MFTFGLAISGPCLHYWYQFLGRRIGGTGLKKGIKTMLVDQCIFAPSIILTFFVATSAIEGKGPAEIKQKLDRDLLTAVKGNYVLWPAAQLINFTLIPTKFAVLYVSNVAVCWNTYICWLTSREDPAV